MTDPREVQPRFKTPPKPKPARRPMRRKAKRGTRPVGGWSTDQHYRLAHDLVMRRCRGVCEHCGTEPATNVHHLAGRGFDGCHHPILLIALCGQGNTSGCHKLAHSVSVATGGAIGLRLPWGTTADDLGGV